MILDQGFQDAMGIDSTRPQGRSWAGYSDRFPDRINPSFPPVVWKPITYGNFLIEAAGRTLPTGNALLLANGQVSASVDWRSPYTGEAGKASPIPQQDGFGYFYFTDKGNPEVFVKVLDWGANRPYLLFHSGLTDFEYAVTFTEVCSGKSVTLRRPSSSFAGGADTTSLPHSGCRTPYVSTEEAAR